VDPVPDPLLLRKSVAPGIEPGTSGSVDHRGGSTYKYIYVTMFECIKIFINNW
jgi:hypothetical protein